MRVRAAMGDQARREGRFMGGRPPYGYGLADAGPHPNPAKAADGRRLRRLERDRLRHPSSRESSPNTWRAADSRPSPKVSPVIVCPLLRRTIQPGTATDRTPRGTSRRFKRFSPIRDTPAEKLGAGSRVTSDSFRSTTWPLATRLPSVGPNHPSGCGRSMRPTTRSSMLTLLPQPKLTYEQGRFAL
jgi:hypothetical protein